MTQSAENDVPAIPSDVDLDALVQLLADARRGGCFRHEGCLATVRKRERDAARRWFLGRVIPPESSAQ